MKILNSVRDKNKGNIEFTEEDKKKLGILKQSTKQTGKILINTIKIIEYHEIAKYRPLEEKALKITVKK